MSRGYELRRSPNPEAHINEILHARPPIPSGRADLSELIRRLEGIPAGEPGYAWERLPAWLAKFSEAYQSIPKYLPIVTLNAGSSTPLREGYLRAKEFLRDGARAKELVAETFDKEAFEELRDYDERLVPIAHQIASDEEARALLVAAVQDCIYQITPEEAKGEAKTNPLMEERILEKLLLDWQSQYVQNIGGDDIESRWGLRFETVESDLTYFERVAEVGIATTDAQWARRLLAQEAELAEYHQAQLRFDSVNGDINGYRELAHQTKPAKAELAARYIAWQAKFLANMIVGNPRYKPARHLSMDAADPMQIAASALANTPAATQELNMFSHAMASLEDPHQHLQGNVFDELPFPPNSIAMITCFDAWPFHFQIDDRPGGEKEIYNAAVATLLEWYDKLAYGGKIVIFPWATNKSSDSDRKADKKALEAALVEFSRRVGHGASRDLVATEVLRSWMSSSDEQILETMSSIFTSKDTHLDVLVISKPTEKSARARLKAMGRKAVSRA